MFNLGPSELIFLGFIIVLLFGAKRVPELFASLGQGIREFKKAMHESESENDKENEKQVKSNS
ncbi:MAG: twin-arginine translocase TatA/TatE family subunit [Armatimonadetes bacterium]|nr:twin-arginine translocase TatA/TatE family subunit [Armatimonadota bacterium]MDW8028027.1 twin-arginine translocase TatA/TatE family subunit [Armatimonadota bacterium]